MDGCLCSIGQLPIAVDQGLCLSIQQAGFETICRCRYVFDVA